MFDRRLGEILIEKGARIYYSDPYIDTITVNNHTFHSTKLTAGFLKQMDCAVITTGHDAFDYPFIAQQSQIIVDSRNATKHLKQNRKKIVRI